MSSDFAERLSELDPHLRLRPYLRLLLDQDPMPQALPAKQPAKHLIAASVEAGWLIDRGYRYGLPKRGTPERAAVEAYCAQGKQPFVGSPFRRGTAPRPGARSAAR